MPASKSKPIIVNKLGVGGVNLTKTPLKMGDNEVAQAQNAEPYTDRGRAGIRKRPAYRPVNTVATGAIQGMISVELEQAGFAADGGDGGGETREEGGDDPDAGGWDPGDEGIGGAAPIGEGPLAGATSDILAGPLVLVARNGYPETASWMYTVDGGVEWHKTSALTNVIASDDEAPIDWTDFALTIQAGFVATATGAVDETLVIPLTLTGFDLIPDTPGTLTIEFEWSYHAACAGAGTSISAWVATDDPPSKMIANRGFVAWGGDLGTFVEDNSTGEALGALTATWATLQAITGAELSIQLTATAGSTVTFDTSVITGARWSAA